jgi:regulator of protease activity HflC (stomatin/prohibitin superfamily)
MVNLDQLLNIIAISAWLFFTIYGVSVFVQSLRREGLQIAILRVLSARVLLPLLLPISLSLLAAALVFIQPSQVAVVISYITPGGVRPQPLRAGLHFTVPILEQAVIYPIAWQTYTMSSKPNEGAKTGDDSIGARTSDGQEIHIDLSIIFRVNYEQVVRLHSDWQDRYVEDFVRPVIRGLVRTQVSQFKVKEVNSSARKDLEATLQRLLTEELGAKGLIVDQLLLRDISFTDEYAAAIEHKQVAMEDEERAIHEAQGMRNLAEGQRDQLTLVAAGEADAIQLKVKAQAEAEADAIRVKAQAQTEALQSIAVALTKNPNLITYEYVEKLSPNIRAMLVPNNAPLILPLPDLMSGMTKDALTTTVAPTRTDSLTSTLPTTTTIMPASDDKKGE